MSRAGDPPQSELLPDSLDAGVVGSPVAACAAFAAATGVEATTPLARRINPHDATMKRNDEFATVNGRVEEL
jgi:hypothetical protein